jgi:hypothetical protein
MNGTDNYIENLESRAISQMTGMRGLLEFVYTNEKDISKMISEERRMLVNEKSKVKVSIQSEHIGNGLSLKLPVFNYKSEKDSIVEITDYRPVVSSLTDVKKPFGYLIPADLTEITDWADRQGLIQSAFQPGSADIIEQYEVLRLNSIDFEGDTIANPVVEVRTIRPDQLQGKYMVIPTAQLKGNLAVIALEPKSMLGLVTYEKYRHLLKPGEAFPILRVMRK